MASSYDWHPSAKGQSVFKVETRNLGWWVLLAILISVVIHILIYIILGGIQRSSLGVSGEEVVWRNTREQVTIDQDKLNQMLDEPFIPEDKVLEPEKLSDMDLVDTSLDEFDLMEQMKDEVIRMAPIETPQVFSGEAPRVPGEALNVAAGGLDISVAEILSKDLDDMRNKLIDSSATVSASQPVLELNDADDLGQNIDTDEFFKEAAAKAFGTKADEFVKGYASLDDLISRTGGLPPGEEKIALPTDILFEFNESELKEQARLSMMKLAFIVQTNPDATFVIEGHSDAIGDEAYNQKLSLKRAEAVRQWLIERLRIDAKNIKVVGMGMSRPIVSTAGTKEEQALNRRVEIVVRQPETAAAVPAAGDPAAGDPAAGDPAAGDPATAPPAAGDQPARAMPVDEPARARPIDPPARALPVE
jgi:outer membrane protein OmpA-like peptidoglycan-associated protein